MFCQSSDCLYLRYELMVLFSSGSSKTNSTNNHKDKNLRQRNTNWAACLLSEYYIMERMLMNMYYQPVATYDPYDLIITERSNTEIMSVWSNELNVLCSQVSLHMYWPYEGKREGRPYQLLPRRVSLWRSPMRHGLWFQCVGVRILMMEMLTL